MDSMRIKCFSVEPPKEKMPKELCLDDSTRIVCIVDWRHCWCVESFATKKRCKYQDIRVQHLMY